MGLIANMALSACRRDPTSLQDTCAEMFFPGLNQNVFLIGAKVLVFVSFPNSV